MFSYFEKGITDTNPSRFIGFPELINIIRNNPHADKIDAIRNLRKNGDEYYKKLKSELPNITPNCMIKVRSLAGYQHDLNFIQFSQYLYYDIDNWNSEAYKEYFITEYGHLASMICISSSGGGISVLFKVKNQLTKDNFTRVWEAVRDTILTAENIDPKCTGLGRAMFISHDPSVFWNIENEIEVQLEPCESIEEPVKKKGKQSKTCSVLTSRLISPFSIISIDNVLEKIVTHTIVPVPNPVVDFKPAEYVEFYIPRCIKDGTKHDTYTSMIHTLVYLNPAIDKEYIFSYLFYINSRFAKPRMEKREFIRLFNLIYEGINSGGGANVRKTIKYVHFNPDCRLSQRQKIEISNYLNGVKRRNESIQKIIDAKTELEQMKRKINQKRIAEISKLSPKTVRKHFNSKLEDINEHVEMINNSIPVEKQANETQNQRLSFEVSPSEIPMGH